MRTVGAVALVAWALLGGLASAQSATQAQPAESTGALGDLGELRRGGVLTKVTREEVERAERDAQATVRTMLEAYERARPALESQWRPVGRKVDQIANEAFQLEREQALDFLGLDPQGSTAVSIFLSWSMPLEMLRAYVLDAMWSGASVYFRGVPPGKDLMPFITKDLRSLVYGKNAANIAIDPRMFDAFEVSAVPTIVFATTRDQLNCKDVAPRTFESGDKTLQYDSCGPIAEDAYWKISGAVSTYYALSTFLEDGAADVKPYVNAIARGFAQGVPPGKGQAGFAGAWEDVLSPQEWEMNRKYEQRLREEEAKKAAPPAR